MAADPDNELRQAAMARVCDLSVLYDDVLPVDVLRQGTVQTATTIPRRGVISSSLRGTGTLDLS